MRILKLFRNKKAESDEISGSKMIFYLIFSFLAAIVFMIIVYLARSNRMEIANIPSGLENYIITQRFLISPLCFAFQDADSKRVYPWVLDLKKFNEENLNKCYSASDTKLKAYRLTLAYGTEKKTISTKNWEGFLKKGETKQVFVNNEGRIIKGELFVEMQDAK